MNVTLDKTSDVTGKFTVSVVEADYADKVKNELKKIGQKRPIPGYRPGHVPAGLLKRMFGRDVKSDVLNNEVYNAVITYIRNNKLHVLGEPMPVEVKEINLDDKDYTFEYEVALAPEVKVELNKDVKLPYYTIEVSKEMFDEQDQALRERFGAQVPGEEVEGKALVKGTIMQLNADGSINENEGAIQVLNGIVAPYSFVSKEETDKFMGKKVNDKVVFNPYATCNGNAVELASMLNLDKEIAKDVKDDFEMAISEIIVLKLAEHDQEFFDNVFGKDKVKTEEEYEAALKDMIAQGLRSNSEQLFNYDAQKYLIDKYGDMPVPTELLKKWLVARNEELTAENIDKEFDEMLPSLKWDLIKDAVMAELDVKVNDDDMLEFAKMVMRQQYAQYGITNMDEQTIEESAKRILNDKKIAQRMYDDVVSNKLFNAIKNAVTVEAKEVSLDEFKKIANGEE